MGLKPTHLLRDDPSPQDEFGTHKRIAALIEREILDAKEGRSIAVVGEWGTGKSTIITLLQQRFLSSAPGETHVFVYDAWSHQGDQLRRAFLDDLVASLAEAYLINQSEKEEATD